MNLASDIKSAFTALAECVKYLFNTPSFLFENVSYGDLLLTMIVFAIIFWLFWDLMRK